MRTEQEIKQRIKNYERYIEYTGEHKGLSDYYKNLIKELRWVLNEKKKTWEDPD